MSHIKIWQQNVNKSRACQHNLLSNNHLINEGVNIIALQEPAIDHQGFTLAARDWVPVYPPLHQKTERTTRSIIFVRADLSSDSWKQLDFPSTDVTAIQIKGEWGKLTIINVYNDCENNETVHLLAEFHRRNQIEIERTEIGTAHVIWVGDFNRHHPYWDDPNDVRLFTNEAMSTAEKLIEVVAVIGTTRTMSGYSPTRQ